jgi:hypothetical protein
MPEELRTALLASKLVESELAATALSEGWQVERVSEPNVVSEMSVTTFYLRAAHVKTLEGEHWQRLAASTEELAEKLRSAIGTAVECMKITGPEEHYFVVFRSAEGGHIFGCMRVRPDGKQVFMSANEPAA